MEEIYPKDWKECKFGDVFDLGGSLSISRANLSDEGICYLHYGDIHKSSDSFIDVNKSYKEIPKYNIALEEVDSKYLLKDGDIVFADASEDYEGIAKSLTVINKDNKPFISGLHTIVARDKSGNIDNNYKRYFLRDWEIRKQLMTLATGTSVLGISQPNLKKIKVYLPPKEEQQKIGTILSNWDKAIELKEKLIEQKKEQKKGLMQKLLTGEVRLPGFKEEWGEVRLDKIAKLSIGLVTTMTTNYVEHGVPLIRNSDIRPNKIKDKLINLEINFANAHKSRMLKKGDIVTVHTGDVGVSAVIEENLDGCLGFATLNTRIVSEQFDPYFISYYFNSEKYINFALRMSTGDGRNNFNLKDFKNSKVPSLPLEEQKEIVKILSDFDRELQLLEEQLRKYKLQKKGLMQLLLTGKVRVKV